MEFIKKEVIIKATNEVITQSEQIIEKLEMVKNELSGFKSRKFDLRFQKELWNLTTKDQVKRERFYWKSQLRNESYNDNGIDIRDDSIQFKVVNDSYNYNETVRENVNVPIDIEGKIDFELLIENIEKSINSRKKEIDKCIYTLSTLDKKIEQYNQIINVIECYNNAYATFYTTPTNIINTYISVQHEIRFE